MKSLDPRFRGGTAWANAIAASANARLHHLTLISLTSKATATFGGKPVRGSAPNALSGGSTTSHFEPAGIWVMTSRIAGISIALTLIDGIDCGLSPCGGCWPHGYGPPTSRATVL